MLSRDGSALVRGDPRSVEKDCWNAPKFRGLPCLVFLVSPLILQSACYSIFRDSYRAPPKMLGSLVVTLVNTKRWPQDPPPSKPLRFALGVLLVSL